MRKFVLCVMFACFLFGCAPATVLTYRDDSFQEYVPPKLIKIENERTYRAKFNKVWESIISFFAYSNIPIKTLEKDSGIIVAEKTLDDVREIEDLVDVGLLRVTTRTYKVTKNNPEWLDTCRAMGYYVNPYSYENELSRQLYQETTHTKDLDVKVLSTFNIFARKVRSGTNVSVNIDYKILSDSKEYKAISKGLFEKTLLDYIDNYLQGKVD